jgi:hypothetical protein
MIKENSIWIFVDETGTSSLDDSSNPIFALGFLATSDPVLISKILSEVKYEIWQEGNNKISQFFHATNDPKIVRAKFYQKIIDKKLDYHHFSFLYVLKEDHFEQMQKFSYGEEKSFKEYIKNGWLIKTYNYLIHTYLSNLIKSLQINLTVTKINLVLSSIFTQKQNEILTKILIKSSQKLLSKYNLQNKINIYWVDNKTDYGCQLADYFTWSVNRNLIRNEDMGFSFLKSRNKFNIENLTDHFLQYNQKRFYEIYTKLLNGKLRELSPNLIKQNTPPIERSYSPEN